MQNEGEEESISSNRIERANQYQEIQNRGIGLIRGGLIVASTLSAIGITSYYISIVLFFSTFGAIFAIGCSVIGAGLVFYSLYKTKEDPLKKLRELGKNPKIFCISSLILSNWALALVLNIVLFPFGFGFGLRGFYPYVLIPYSPSDEALPSIQAFFELYLTKNDFTSYSVLQGIVLLVGLALVFVTIGVLIYRLISLINIDESPKAEKSQTVFIAEIVLTLTIIGLLGFEIIIPIIGFFDVNLYTYLPKYNSVVFL